MRIYINDLGILPDTGIVLTKELQQAIDTAFDHSAELVFPKGEYITGTLDLRGVSICLERGAVLRASTDKSDYRTIGYHHNEMGDVISLLYSFNADGMNIYGEGTIDLCGDSFYFKEPNLPNSRVPLTDEQITECCYKIAWRPNQPIFFYQPKNIVIEGITILNAPCWTMSFIEGENIRITDVTVKGHPNVPNNDGMHFCSCNKVFIRGCNIDTADDCIALSAITDWDKACENIVISDCILRSFSKALSIGYMHSIVKNVTISKCVISDTNRGFVIMASSGTGLVENITVSNLVIDTRVRAGNWWGNGEPLLIMATYHHNYSAAIPNRHFEHSVRNVIFSNIICNAENAIGIIGENDNITDTTLENVIVHLKESDNIELKGHIFDLAPSKQADTVPQDGKPYILAARNAEKLHLHNVYGYGINGEDGDVFCIFPW